MDFDYIKKKSFSELVEIGNELKLENIHTLSKKELIEKIIKCFKEYEDYINSKNEYKKIKRIGNKGKEGITYLVSDKNNKKYAMKTFKKNKSVKNIETEVNLQKLASKKGICPKIYDFDIINNNIVMDLMDEHLMDMMERQNGNLTENQQKEIINIFKKLDETNVFHGDSNILNYMLKDGKIYIIDFGMSKLIDDKLKKKLKEEKINYNLMNLGFILKLKELKCPESSYSYLLKQVSNENKKKYNLI